MISKQLWVVHVIVEKRYYMRKVLGFILLISCACAVGWAAYTFVPQYVFWVNWRVPKDTGPLIWVLVFVAALAAFLASLLPLGIVELFALRKNKITAALVGAICGGPVTVTLAILWLNERIGGAYEGLSWVVFGGATFIVFPYVLLIMEDGPQN